MLLNEIQPSSIDGIKRLAKQIKSSECITHTVALDRASRAAKFENFIHARRVLSNGSQSEFVGHDLYITAYWRDRDTEASGRETLKITLLKPLDDLIRPAQYRLTRALEPMQREAIDHVSRRAVVWTQSSARRDCCAAARMFQFMDATGLKPSKAHSRSYPKGDYQNRIPGSDHGSAWYDPVAKQHVTIDEPYRAAAAHHVGERKAWEEQHGWTIEKPLRGGMYNPDGGCELYMTADTSKGYSLALIVAALNVAQPPIVEAEWMGESAPYTPSFFSPGTTTSVANVKPKPKPQTRRPSNSVPYSMFLTGQQRRPANRMKVDDHAEVGRLLKSVLIETRSRTGVYKRVNSIRSQLDDWVQCEYGDDELSAEVFFDLYYRKYDRLNHPNNEPKPFSEHVASLNAAKAILTKAYPDCVPLRAMLRKADLAIDSLQKWAR
jgi:hypothetical protein